MPRKDVHASRTKRYISVGIHPSFGGTGDDAFIPMVRARGLGWDGRRWGWGGEENWGRVVHFCMVSEQHWSEYMTEER